MPYMRIKNLATISACLGLRVESSQYAQELVIAFLYSFKECFKREIVPRSEKSEERFIKKFE